MAAELFVPPSKALDANADPYAGAKWFFYATGTTTPQTVYTTAARNVAHANPVVADSSGKFANIFFDPALVYRGVLTNADESVVLHDIDPVNSGILSVFGATNGASLVGYEAGGTGDISESLQAVLRRWPLMPEQFGAVGDGVTDDTAALQNAIARAEALGVPIWGAYGKTYLISSTLNPTGGIALKGDGSTIKSNTHIRMLWLKANSYVDGIKFEGPGGTYNAAGFGIYAGGTRNGAGIAPTFCENIWITNCRFANIGQSAIELRYCKGIRINNADIRNIGLHGILGFASEDIIANNTLVDGVNGDGSLNAYGITWTSDTSSIDRVRDPRSKRCFAFGGRITNIPAWHGLDMHGGDNCGFDNFTVINCRRAAVITSLPEIGSSNSYLRNIKAYNFYGATEKNSNGTFKRSEAFWDVGASASARSIGNVIECCYSYGHGAPDSVGGATIVQFTSGGIYQSITDVNAYNSGMTLTDYAEGIVKDCTSINPRGVGVSADSVIATLNGTTTLNVTSANTSGGNIRVGHFVTGLGIPADTYIASLGTGTGGVGTYIMSQSATASGGGVAITAVGSPLVPPMAILVTSGDYQQIEISGHHLIRSNPALDVQVAVNGIYLAAGTANRNVKMRNNDFDQASATPVFFAAGLTGYTGDYSIDITYTATGVTGTVTGIGKAFRRDGNVTLNLPVLSGTSDATTFTLTGLFTNFAPAVARNFTGIFATDNSVAVHAGVTVETTGVLTVKNGLALGAWTASGTKAIAATTISYPVTSQ